MRITLHSGETIELPWSEKTVSGYSAQKIEIDAADIYAMRSVAEFDPFMFSALMTQFASRLDRGHDGIPQQCQESQCPHKSGIIVRPKHYECPVCGSNDLNHYLNCQFQGCPDGRDPR